MAYTKKAAESQAFFYNDIVIVFAAFWGYFLADLGGGNNATPNEKGKNEQARKATTNKRTNGHSRKNFQPL